MRGDGELAGPAVERQIPRVPCGLIERVHPFGQIMEILPIPVPLDALVERSCCSALIERLADAQASLSRMRFSFRFGEPTDPAPGRAARAMATEDAMHAIDESQRELEIAVFAGRAREAEKVGDGERIGPQIASLWSVRLETGSFRKLCHQFDSQSDARTGYDARAHGVDSPTPADPNTNGLMFIRPFGGAAGGFPTSP